MSDRDEFYRRFSKSYDKLYQSEKRDDLVERVAHVFWETPGTPDERLRVVLALALEEAARVVEDPSVVRNAAGHAAAIRAMIPKENT